MPLVRGRAPGLRAHVVLAEDAAGNGQQREFARDLLVARDVLGVEELALAAH
ncbi:hypothetical protein [Candidatus Aalborgicola defluviihabitans]|uniref:hypothetical protein n=1 Tax=Candidatus Aalborgicola defluviihabitans TaxID=3386187 RepID=UPI0039B90E6E